MARGGVRVQILGQFDPRAFKEAEKAAQDLSTQFKGLATQLGAAFATREVINFARSAVSAASDLEESINAVNVTFGDASAGILGLGENAATAVGLSAREFNSFAVQFSGFTSQIAGAEGDIVAVTDELTTRIADFASVMNKDIPEAAQVFQSALAGETEPIRKFGIDMSAAAVQAFALREGMVASASEMTEAIKVQARYGLLMESTNKVAGDFANTSGSLANQTRIMVAQFDDFRSTVGAALVPTLQNLMGVAKPVLEAFTAMPDQIQQLVTLSALAGVGFKSMSTSLQGLGVSARVANTSLGLVGLALYAGVTLYNSYATNKQDAIDKTNTLVAALKSEAQGHEDATKQALLNELTTGRLGDAVAELGLSAADVTRFIMGEQVPALDELLSSLDRASIDTHTFKMLQEDLGITLGGNAADLIVVSRETEKWRDALTRANTVVARGEDAARELGISIEGVADATQVATHQYSQFGDVVLESADDVRVFLRQTEMLATAREREDSANRSAITSFVALGEALGHPIQRTRELVRQLGLLDGLDVEVQIELGLFTQAEAALEMLDLQIRAVRTSMIALGQGQFMQKRLAPLFQLRNELVGLISEEASTPFTGGNGGAPDPVDEAQQDFERYVDAVVSFGNNLLTRDFAGRLFDGTPESITETFRDLMDDVTALTEGQLDQSLRGLIGNLQGRFAQLAELARLRETLQDQLDGIRDVVEATGAAFATGLEASADVSLREQIETRVNQARTFVANLRKLVGMGFPSAIIGDIVNAGLVDGAAMAAELASFDPTEVREFVSEFAQLGTFTREAQALVSQLLGGPEVEEALSGTNDQMSQLVTAIQTDLVGAVNTFLSGLGAQVDRLIGVPSGGTVSGGATMWHPIHGQVPADGVMRSGDKGAAVNVTVNAGIGTDGVQVGKQIVQVLNEYSKAGGAGVLGGLLRQ